MKAKDLASLLNVSPATVSLVVNNKPGISHDKRNEILNKIYELNLGHLIKSTKTKTNIGFVIYKRRNKIIEESPFFNNFLEEINDTLIQNGYNLKIIYLNTGISESEQVEMLIDSDCVGFVVFAVEMIYSDIAVFQKTDLPFVMLDNYFKDVDVDTVAINNHCGINTAVNYLYDMGHRKIGYIRSKIKINSFHDRFSSYRRMLSKLNLDYCPEHTVYVGYSDMEAGQDMLNYLTYNSSLPTCFICDNDLIACGAMRGIMEYGLNIPEDISVVGFDDRPICTYISPNLTTMRVHAKMFGRQAVELLIYKINNKLDSPIKIEISTNLVKRQSVKFIDLED